MAFKIREVRESLHMSQEELAKKSGVCRTTISQLENQTLRTTSTKTLLKIAKGLNTTVDKIFFNESV